MSKSPVSVASTAVLLIAVLAAAVCFSVHFSASYSEPQGTASTAVRAAASADLASLGRASTRGYYEDMIGHFGEGKFKRVRAAYQRAYDLALPRWLEYRQRAESAAADDYRKLRGRVDTLGREAVGRLSLDERMRLTEDRGKYAEFVFQEGLKALPPEERKKIGDAEAFRQGRDFRQFVDREAWKLLSAQDRESLGSPAVLSSGLTPEKTQFLAKVGVALLSAREKEEIAGISVSDLSSPRDFMLRHGDPVAKEFLARAAIDANTRLVRCTFPDQESRGSLLRGPAAVCQFEIAVRGTVQPLVALLRKDGFDWKLDWLQPDFFQIREAYPPEQAREEAAASRPPTQGAARDYPERIETVRLPDASWDRRPAPAGRAPLDALLGMVRSALVSPLLWAGFALLFIAVMTINYLRLRNEKFVPEWLEGEQQLEELVLPGWWMRTITRLTNRRILQVRLNWFLSKRKVYAIALDDIHSVVWRRYTNWVLIAAAVYFVGSSNPLALLLMMLGLEAKFHSIRFNTPFAQMLRTNMVVTSFHRKHFNELARFFRKAQLHWAQVRTQKQLPAPGSADYRPESDQDFRWGLPVWAYVGVWMAFAIGQRLFGSHVTLDDYVIAPLLLGLPIAVALRSRRDALWSALLGLSAMLSVKFPGSLIPFLPAAIPGLPAGSDGGAPHFEQYFAALAVLVLASVAAAAVARAVPAVGFFAPALWLGFVAAFSPNQLLDTAIYGKCALAIAAAVLWSWLDAALFGPRELPAPAVKTLAHDASA